MPAEARVAPGPLYAGPSRLAPPETERAWAQDRAVAAICLDQRRALISVIDRRGAVIISSSRSASRSRDQ